MCCACVHEFVAGNCSCFKWSCVMLQHKRQTGNGKAVLTASLQAVTDLLAEKHHPVLDRLFCLASKLLAHCSTSRCTAPKALADIKSLAALVPSLD